MARSAAFVWPLEQHLHPLPRLGEGGRLAAVVRRRLGRARPGIRPGRRHHRQGPSSRTGCKRGTQSQAIGRSKGGLTTKILALTDALGNLVRFVLLPGQRFDTVGVPPLIDGVAFGALIADTAFDSNDIIADLNERGAKAVIAQHPRRTTPLDIDAEMYKWRHLIENFFCKLKEFKRIALRAARYTTLLRAVELWGAVQADGPGRLAGDEEPTAVDGFVVGREEDLSQQPTCADGAPLWVKMVALRAGLAEPLDGDRVEAGKSAVACDPDQQSGPRCAEVPFFVAPGTREHAWQCLERTCGATIACSDRGGEHAGDDRASGRAGRSPRDGGGLRPHRETGRAPDQGGAHLPDDDT